MNKAFKALFEPIKAEEALKESTKAFIAEQINDTVRTAKRRRYHAYALACVCLLLVLIGGPWMYFTPTAEISIDINPSIELSLNRFDRVIAVTAYNEDGQELSRELNVKYKNYAEAVDEILSHDSITALLNDDGLMTITVVCPDGQRSARLLSGVETCAEGHGDTYCYHAQPEEAVSAHEAGLSCGKYRAFLELQRLDPDITPEAVQGMTMREIQDMINGLLPEGDESYTFAGESGGNHNGHGHGCD